MKLYKIPVLDT